MRKPQTIWVRNNGNKTFNDRYDGEDFQIKPGHFIEMLVECATLCLGFGEDDKIRCVRRLGWAFSHDAMKSAIKELGEFSFHMSEKEAIQYASKDRVIKATAVAKGKKNLSSAPEIGEPSVDSDDDSEGVPIPVASNNPLKKLAQATLAAG